MDERETTALYNRCFGSPLEAPRLMIFVTGYNRVYNTQTSLCSVQRSKNPTHHTL
jgi:hypothetical protein